ncbi:MAG: hypothetical protein OSJ62_06955 [Lachnospiraceae bacterium]|nr:hypothetical protein [Lachnospiraceae bacterium]
MRLKKSYVGNCFICCVIVLIYGRKKTARVPYVYAVTSEES